MMPLRQRTPAMLLQPTTATPDAPACRPACAACCTAPSISSPIPGMPHGKPAGQPCVQLDDAGRCRLFGLPERPAVCSSLQPSMEMCGSDRSHAMRWLARLEAATSPVDDQPAAASAAGSTGRG
jgi:hypothetical protein